MGKQTKKPQKKLVSSGGITSAMSGDQRLSFRDREILTETFKRQRLFQDHFQSETSFRKFVDSQPYSEAVKHAIRETVTLCRADIATIASDTGQEDLEKGTPEKQYLALVSAHYVDPSSAFANMPSVRSLCELDEMSEAYMVVNDDMQSPEHKIIQAERATAEAIFLNRWRSITGEQLEPGTVPRVSRLTDLVAPVPYRSTWSEGSYVRESARMRDPGPKEKAIGGGLQEHSEHRTVADYVVSDSEDSSTPPAGEENAGEMTNESAESGDGQSDANMAERENAVRTACSIDELYGLAGAHRLAQPKDGSGYTFPGQLNWGEEILYDYAVMVPIDECSMPQQDVDLDERNLIAARASARFALGFINFLRSQQLEGALGPGVVDDLEALLNDVLAIPSIPDPGNLPEKAGTRAIRSLKKRLMDTAALVRSISSMRMFFIPTSGTNPAQFVADLDAALIDFPPISQKRRKVPSELDRGEARQSLQINDAGAQENQVYTDARDFDGEFGPPDANDDGRVMFEWTWQTSFQNKKLRRYVEYLGSTFYRKLTNLRDTAEAASQSIHRFSGQSSDVLADFAALAEGVLNDVLMGLSRLFDNIAEQLSLHPTSPVESTKRLALMVTFRQHWLPEGYVAGKLVGYKNLLPSQKDQFKRRTFVKSTRELSTVEEFAASRSQDFSRSSKETSEVINESSSLFNFSLTTSGSFDLLIASGDITASTAGEWRSMSRSTQNRIAEATQKSSVKFSEKREVKVRQLTEVEDVQEVSTEVENLNREITANYFYYQLHRQYLVDTELHSVKPVILRTRDVPDPAAVDEKFLSDQAYILIHALPAQLSVDLQEVVSEVQPLSRELVRRRSDSDQSDAMYQQFRGSNPPADPEQRSQWQTQLETMERRASETRTAYIDAEDAYWRARTRLDRVATHVRENICYYMQYVWQTSPKVDQDKLLQHERFNGYPLAEVTRGFTRLGYYGNEEIFEYAGPSIACVDVLKNMLVPGQAILSSMSAEDLEKTPMYQRLRRFYSSDDHSALKERIRSHLFLTDPSRNEESFSTRRVQLAQDAVVVEAMPGRVPLLEGFQMAHRMLDVQEQCLENLHLRERIQDRPWTRDGEDNYSVSRRDGSSTEISLNVGGAETE